MLRYCHNILHIFCGCIAITENAPDPITERSLWARWRLKSPASRVFTQQFIQGVHQRKHQSSAPLAFVRGIRR